MVLGFSGVQDFQNPKVLGVGTSKSIWGPQVVPDIGSPKS